MACAILAEVEVELEKSICVYALNGDEIGPVGESNLYIAPTETSCNA